MTRPSGSTPAGGAPVGPASGDLVGSYPAPTVARLRNRLVSAAAPSLDDVLAWTGTEFAPRVLFGAELSRITRTTPLTTSSTPLAPVSYLSLGSSGSPILLTPTYRYLAIASYTVNVSASNTSHWLDVRVNGLPSAAGPTVEPLGEANAQSRRCNVSTFLGSEIGPSVYYDMVVAKSSGTGSVTLRSATLALWRIA